MSDNAYAGRTGNVYPDKYKAVLIFDNGWIKYWNTKKGVIFVKSEYGLKT